MMMFYTWVIYIYICIYLFEVNEIESPEPKPPAAAQEVAGSHFTLAQEDGHRGQLTVLQQPLDMDRRDVTEVLMNV